MMLMIFVFTVLGMQLFGASLNPSLESYAEQSYALTTRFDTFYWSFVQVSQLVRPRAPPVTPLVHASCGGGHDKMKGF